MSNKMSIIKVQGVDISIKNINMQEDKKQKD
jgi:hypothetical protein